MMMVGMINMTLRLLFCGMTMCTTKYICFHDVCTTTTQQLHGSSF